MEEDFDFKGQNPDGLFTRALQGRSRILGQQKAKKSCCNECLIEADLYRAQCCTRTLILCKSCLLKDQQQPAGANQRKCQVCNKPRTKGHFAKLHSLYST